MGKMEVYPLANKIAMENHHFLVGISTIIYGIFNSYVKLLEGTFMLDKLHIKSQV